MARLALFEPLSPAWPPRVREVRSTVRSTAFSAVVAIIAVGCSPRPVATPPESTDEPSPAPVLSVQWEDRGWADVFVLSWPALSGFGDGYELEERIGDGAFVPLRNLSTGLGLFWGSGTEIAHRDRRDLTTVGFRLRAVRGESRSLWSAVASATTGLHPARSLTAAATVEPNGTLVPPVTLRWQEPSSAALEVVAERARVVSGLAREPFELLPAVPATDGVLVDYPPDDAIYMYRVRRRAGETWSPAVTASVAIPPTPPEGLRAEVTGTSEQGPDAVAISWSNRSLAVTSITVRRWNAPIAELAPEATSYLDPSPVWANWTYALWVRGGELGRLELGGFARTPAVHISPFVLQGEPPVIANEATLPCSYPREVRRDSQGRFACFDSGSSGAEVFNRADGISVVESVPLPVDRALTYLLLDDLDRPHVTYDDGAVHHLWLAGPDWIDETVPLPPDAYSLGSGITGSGEVLLLVGYGPAIPGSDRYSIVRRREAGWVEAPIDAPPTSALEILEFMVDRDGNASVLASDETHGAIDTCALARLGSEESAATFTIVPGTGAACTSGDRTALLLGITSGRAAMAYRVGGSTGDWTYREYGPEGLAAPELIATEPGIIGQGPLAGSLSTDGRAALALWWRGPAASDPLVAAVFVRQQPGSWRRLTLGPRDPGSPGVQSMGFLPDGRLWLLANRASHYPYSFAFYEEL